MANSVWIALGCIILATESAISAFLMDENLGNAFTASEEKHKPWRRDLALLMMALASALGSYGSSDPWVVFPCFVVSAASFIALCFLNDWPRNPRLMAILLGTVLLGLVGVRSINSAIAIKRTPNALTDIVIEPSYDFNPMGLPLLFDPGASAFIIFIEPGRKIAALNIRNEKSEVKPWPVGADLFPPEGIGEIRLSNHGDRGVYNVSFGITFDIGMTSDPNGISHVPFTLPLFDIPKDGTSPPFYIVNQSSEPAFVFLSKRAQIQAQGETVRRTVGMQPRNITFWDSKPMILPTSHTWQGSTILPPFKPSKKGTR